MLLEYGYLKMFVGKWTMSKYCWNKGKEKIVGIWKTTKFVGI